MGQVQVGTASWTDRTLLESGWYPPEADTPERRLRYYARQFGLVEVDATYYALPAEQTAAAWAARTPAGFVFNVKACSLFTQHPTRVAALPADLRPAADKTGKERVYLKDLDPAVTDQAWERFLSALEPLRQAGKLGAILLQFPFWFPIGRSRKEYIVACAEKAAPRRVCVEFRNPTWMTPDNQAETLDFLASHRLPYVGVDMPQGHRDSIPPVLAATDPDLAVHPDHGQIGIGGREHRRDGVPVALRHVHAHVGQPVGGEEIQGLGLVVRRHPGGIAELHAHPPRCGLLGAGHDVLLAAAADGEPERELQQDGAQLPGLAQRLQRGQEPLPRLVGDRGVEVLQVDPLLARLVRRRAQVGGQGRDPGGVLGEQAERLDVEDEPGRGPRRPGRGGLLGGQRVVGGVHLDQPELPRVVAQPLLRRVCLRRIPAGGDQRPVRPRRRAHPDLAHTRSIGNPGRLPRPPALRE